MDHTGNRLVFIDVLNVLACICVVALHCTLTVFNFSIRTSWFVSMFIQVIAHWAVPIFLMISGATLLNYRSKYSTSVFLKKRIMRTFIPFLIWTSIYIVINISNNSLIIHNVRDVIDVFLNNKAQGIFWFFYILFPIYLCIPILSLLAKKENFKVVAYLFLICFFNTAIIPIVSRFVTLPYYFNIPIASGYIGYILLGWLLNSIEIKVKYRYLIYIGGVAGALLMYFGTVYLSINKNSLDILFMDYQSVSCYLISAAVFVFAKYINWNIVGNKMEKTLKLLSGASLGVYLVQMLFINSSILLFNINQDSVMFMGLGTILIYIICVLLVISVKKIPFIRRIFP